MKTMGDLFEAEPDRWGLRGDPFLWKDLVRAFDGVPLPDSAAQLTLMLEGAFAALTGHSLKEPDNFYIARYAHGGMSSGHVDPEFWRRRVMPLLSERFMSLENS